MSDVNGIVTGLQGNPVKEETLGSLQDGYDLTWKDGYWQALPKASSSGGLRKEYFTSSGTWICPAGVTNILVIAAGGGGGGSYAQGSSGGGGGGSALANSGAGGAGGGYGNSNTGGNGGNGGSGYLYIIY